MKNVSLFILMSFSLLPFQMMIAQNSGSPPNFIIILADDLGYADLGCYGGAKGYSTPHLDGMAKTGLKMTSLYSASPICSPSRAGLLTGRDPMRMGIAEVFFPTSWTGMPTEEITLAEALQPLGYSTGIIGKWHLGHHHKYLPLQQGFDEYFGIPYSNDMEGVVYIEGNEVVEDSVDQRFTTRIYTEKALDFLDRHQDEPLFLFLSHSMPHVPIYASPAFEGMTERGLYGDVIREIDWSVGEILERISRLGLEEKTIVLFTSDNGPWISFGPEGGSADPLRGAKMYTFEGGMRVPGLLQWKGRVSPGAVHEGMLSFLDIFPTFLQLAGGTVSDKQEYDGVDIGNVLLEGGDRSKDEVLYTRYGEFAAFRKGDWKIKMPFEGVEEGIWTHAVPPHDTLLFNLKEDVAEQVDLGKTHPEKVRQLAASMENAIERLGPLPPPLEAIPPVDESHIRKNKKRLGIE